MKILVSVILSLSLIFQTFKFQLEDLGDFGVLVEHMQFHSSKYGDSITDFLSKHYGTLKMEHSDKHPEHEKLPFNHKSSTASVADFLLNFQGLPALKVPLVDRRPNAFFYSISYSSLSLEEIFQPPRAA